MEAFMAGDALTQATPSRTLTGVALAYLQRNKFIADKVAPIILVDTKTGDSYRFGKKNNFTRFVSEVGADGKISEVGWTIEKIAYLVKDFALAHFSEKDLDTALRLGGLDPAQIEDTEFLMGKVMLDREIRVAAKLFASGNYGAGFFSTPAVKWDQPTGIPIDDILDAKLKLLGEGRTVVIMGAHAWRVFQTNAQVLSALGRPGGNTGMGISAASLEAAAYILGVDEVVVGEGRADTNDASSATLSDEFIWTDNAAVVRVPDRPGKKVASFAYTYRYLDSFQEAALGQDSMGVIASSMYENRDRGIRGGYFTKVGFSEDFQIVGPGFGYLLTDVKT
jgi:hypothetical protein